ncbi:MAG: sulfatase-like hydrolase/transferase [Halobacteriales archaeon]
MSRIGSSPRRPNVLWILLEDVSPRLGCYGDDLARSPNVDRIAEEGRRYTNAFCSSPVCSPSRSALHTGMYQTAIGTQHHRASRDAEGLPGAYTPVPPHYVKLVSEYLRRAGYHCTIEGQHADFQLGVPDSAFDDATPDADWRGRDDGQPFFSVVNPSQTHESGMWPEDDESLVTDPGDVDLPPYLPDAPETRRALARHYDNIERADEQVGTILNRLEADGVLEDTAVFVLSDHGEGLPREKRWLYDSGIRVPLIVRLPGEVPAGTVSDELLSLVDVGPTTLSLADLDVPEHMQGRVVLDPDRDAEREYVYAARDRHDDFYDTVRAVRDDRFKYVRNYRPEEPYLRWNSYRSRHPAWRELHRLHLGSELKGAEEWFFRETRPTEELYDLEADPHEVHNLAGDPEHARALDRLREALDAWLERTDDRGFAPEYQEVDRMWPEGEQPTAQEPLFAPVTRSEFGVEPSPDGGTCRAPAELMLHSRTEGTSIVYSLDGGDWTVYTGPIDLPTGETQVRAKAVRYGFEDSEVSEASFAVHGGAE